MRSIAAPVLALTVLCTGCASVTQGSTHPLRIETITERGELIDGADCTLRNDHGTAVVRSGSSARVRRSGQDLDVTCTAAGQPEAQARLVSRANAGLAGNILIGGAVGAFVDHTSGSGYTYPGWVRLVFGQFHVFDRRDEREGMALAPPGVAVIQGDAIQLQNPSAAFAPAIVPAKGDTFDYVLTDRTTGATQTVILRVERVEGGEIIFNNGARVESMRGEPIRMNAALVGELDQVTPRAGWMSTGRVPRGHWKIAHTSTLSGSRMIYDLDAHVEGEHKIRIGGREVRAVRVALRGWVENHAGFMPARARYEGTAWLAPELQRVVRFEAKADSGGSYGGASFRIDEQAELVRFGRD